MAFIKLPEVRNSINKVWDAVVHEHDVGGLLAHVSPRCPHGHPHTRPFARRGVIDTIANMDGFELSFL